MNDTTPICAACAEPFECAWIYCWMSCLGGTHVCPCGKTNKEEVAK